VRILIIQLRRIGDILLTTPVISYLKSALPEAKVEFLAEPMGRAVLESNPNLDALHIYDKDHPLNEIRELRRRGYTAVIDFLNNPRSAALTALSGARWRVGYRTTARSVVYNFRPAVPAAPEYVPARKLRLTRDWLAHAGQPHPEPRSLRPELFLRDQDNAFAQNWMKEKGLSDRGFFVLVPAHRHPIRAWTPEGFRETAFHLKRTYKMPVFLAWGPGEEGVREAVRVGVTQEIGVLPPTTLPQMAAIFRRSRLVVTNDSGAMHLAVSVGTPTVTVYGPTRPVDWNPSLAERRSAPHDIAVQASHVPCLGCHLLQCPVGHRCMKELPFSNVADACDALIKEAVQ
jgi:ADP-heptose:LPS heptosyltransferase